MRQGHRREYKLATTLNPIGKTWFDAERDCWRIETNKTNSVLRGQERRIWRVHGEDNKTFGPRLRPWLPA